MQRFAIGMLAVMGSAGFAWGQDLADASKLVGQVRNPVVDPANPNLIAYERLLRDAQELYVYHYGTGHIMQVRGGVEEGTLSDAEVGFLNRFTARDTGRLRSYDGQLAWRPRLDAQERQWFAFVSSSRGEIDLYLSYVEADGRLAAEPPLRLSFSGTEHAPQWSPDGTSLVFASGSEESSDLFWVPDMTAVIDRRGEGFQPVALTTSPAPELFPVWSPDGRYVAFQALLEQDGRQNWGISLIAVPRQAGLDVPVPNLLTAELSTFDEFKPSWSPDGQHIAYYVSENETDQQRSDSSDLGVLALVRDEGGAGVTGSVLAGFTQRLAHNVVPHESRGPTWVLLNDGVHLVYVVRDAQAGFPLFVADLAQWQENLSAYAQNFSGQFDTHNHRDPVVAPLSDGLRVIFVSQEGSANRLQVFDLSQRYPRALLVEVELSRGAAVRKSLILPGTGQFYKGQGAKGAFFLVAEAAALGAVAFFTVQNSNHADDAEVAMRAYEDALKDVIDPGASTSAEAQQHLEAWRKAHDDAERARSTAVVATAAAAGIWVLNVLDSSLGFPRVVRRPVRVAAMDAQPRLLFAQHAGVLHYGLGIRLTF